MAGYSQARRVGQLHTPLGTDRLLLLRMTAVERLSEPYSVIVDCVSEDPQDLHKILGQIVSVRYFSASSTEHNRWFSGRVWEYVELERDEQGFHYRLTLRPDFQFMTLNRRSRIFQKKSAKDIANSTLTFDKIFALNAAYTAMEYCVQYGESDFDFISRLLEHEGIYYYFEHGDGKHTMHLVDNRTAHTPLSPASADVLPRAAQHKHAHFWSVVERRGVGPVKYTVSDYDFETPSRDLKKTRPATEKLGVPAGRWKKTAKGTAGSWADSAEIYTYPAKYETKTAPNADRFNEAWLDAQRRQMARSFAEGDLFCATVGKKLKLKFKDMSTEAEFLIVGTTHRYSSPPYHTRGAGESESLTVEVELMPVAEQYRPAHRTPRPRILGPQTAIVVGPKGEEIYTDQYGRIKVQFHWDREGKQDEKSSCFIRVMQSVAGKSWGSFTLPRIGQEVVVEFLDGDPDRPLVTGAVYNADNMAPAALPDNQTQHGLRSRSTKGGGGYNHWWVEDKKGDEVVWFRAEREYKAHVVNANEERQYDEGNRTTLFKKGNDSLTLSAGNLTTTLDKGDETRTLKLGKRTTTIQQDETLTVKMGNRSATINMGNEALTVKMGNVDIKVDLGSHKTEAMQAIELKCGMSSIKMDPASITIKSMMVKIEGSIMLETKGLMVQQEASAVHIVKGGIVMIN